jgi:hypothetical protein
MYGMNHNTERTLTLEWRQTAEITASGTICPVPGCGALVVTYGTVDSIYGVTRRAREHWEFVCSECGAEFSARKRDLVFESVPRDWLLADPCRA